MRNALLLCVIFFFAASALAQEDGLTWLDKYDDAIKESKRTQKPIFLEFRCEP